MSVYFYPSLKGAHKPRFSFSCGKLYGKLRDQCKIVTDRYSGRQVALLIPPFILVYLVIIAEAYLDGRKVLPHIIVLFSLYKLHAK